MEYFVNDPRVVSTFAKHYETREPLSSSKIEAFCQSEKLCSAVEMQTQVSASLSDLFLCTVYRIFLNRISIRMVTAPNVQKLVVFYDYGRKLDLEYIFLQRSNFNFSVSNSLKLKLPFSGPAMCGRVEIQQPFFCH